MARKTEVNRIEKLTEVVVASPRHWSRFEFSKRWSGFYFSEHMSESEKHPLVNQRRTRC